MSALPPKPKDPTCLNARMTELGVTVEQNTFRRVWTSKSDELIDGKTVTTEKENTRDYPMFDCDDYGNIVIRYFNLQGQPYRWKDEEHKTSRDFIRKRLKEPKGSMKYYQDPGSPQFPFFPPGIIRKYQAAITPAAAPATDEKREVEFGKANIQTLFLVEGEFKAFKGEMCGIDIIGLPSIHGFYNGDIKGKLHEDIEELIVRCNVQKIVLLFDADLLSLKWEENKDLAKRANSFYGAVKAFRESVQLVLDDDRTALELIYFMNINIKFLNDAKGLDDLLCKYADKVSEIKDDLMQFQFARKYFEGLTINDISKDIQGKLFRHLGLMDEQDFYKTYADFIGPREFKFKRRRYIYDQESKEVKFVRHEDADRFMRIGPDWCKVITKLNKHGEKEEEIVSWKISEIQRDYKKFPDFIDQILRYDDFCNDPNWGPSYQRSIAGCFNVCDPLKWQAKEGSIAQTVKFLKHIFQGKGQIILDDQGRFEREDAILGDQFTVALDYLTILLKNPKTMLPVPVLVSPENRTGKSTFLKWLQMIFGSNMCILGNAQFQMKFNGHYATKFLISIDEGFLEVDKKAEKERLKQLVTADSIYLEFKGMNVRKIAYYAKLIICSNDADRVMKIEDGESRWFVVRVPVLTGPIDPDLETKMKSEVEAWLHFLMNRPVHHPREDRLWFKPEYFITDQFKVIVEATKNRINRVFEDWIREQFMLYRLPVLRYTLTYLLDVFNDPKASKYKIDAIELKAYLYDVLKMKAADFNFRFKIPVAYSLSDPHTTTPEIVYKDVNGRPLKFMVENWLTPDQIAAWQLPIPGLDEATNDTKVTPARVPSSTDDLPF